MNLLGKDILIAISHEKNNAKALDIYSDGGLKIRKKNGEIDKVYKGNVRIRSVQQK